MPDAMVAPSGAPPARPGAPVPPATGYTPNPTMQQYQGQPPAAPSGAAASSPASAVAPVTPDPRDAAYYDQLARLTYAYNTSLAGYGRDVTNATGGYNYATGQLAAQEPLALQQDRNRANAAGLLESGQLAQTAGGTEAGYAARRYAALSRMNGLDSAATDRLTAAQGAYNLGSNTAIQQAIARAGRADLANQPVSPPPPRRVSPRAMARGGATTAGSMVGSAAAMALTRMAAKQGKRGR